MLAGKAGAYPKVELLKGASLGKAPGLTQKHQAKLYRPNRDKHSSSFRKIVNYGCKFFITLSLGCEHNLHFNDNSPRALAEQPMEQRTFKNVNNYLNTNIYSYLETSGSKSSILYLNVVHFLNTSIKQISAAA